MTKLGYTFYIKDWSTSENVFQLNLAERGLFRELIDLAMLNDNNIKLNKKVWIRKFNTTQEELDSILSTLQELELIEITDTIFIPSCEARLLKVRAGRKGGQAKPQAKQQANPKQIDKQKKIKEKEIKYNKEELYEFFNRKIEENNLDSKKVWNQVADATEYYKDLNWTNSKGRKIINLKNYHLEQLDKERFR